MYAPLEKKEDKKSSPIQKKSQDNNQIHKSHMKSQNNSSSYYNTNQQNFYNGKSIQYEPTEFLQWKACLVSNSTYNEKPVEYKSFFSKSLFNQSNKNAENNTVQLKSEIETEQYKIQSKANNTGIPTPLKNQFEAISGFSFDDVKVHYNSNKPAQLQALAYTQGNQVYIGTGQEGHLKHELGHVYKNL